MEQKNQEQAQVQQNVEQPKEKKSAWQKAKKVGAVILEVAVVAGLGFLGGALASKYGYVNKEQYDLAQAQKSFLDRRNGNN